MREPVKRAEASRLSPQVASREFARVLRPWPDNTRGLCKWTSTGLREREAGCCPFVSGNERTLPPLAEAFRLAGQTARSLGPDGFPAQSTREAPALWSPRLSCLSGWRLRFGIAGSIPVERGAGRWVAAVRCRTHGQPSVCPRRTLASPRE